jgi:hypothetical protein
MENVSLNLILGILKIGMSKSSRPNGCVKLNFAEVVV